MKAIGYIRWSRDDQSDGHSLERQTKNIADYCSSRGLTLTSTLVDDGLSAFTGENADKGKLGELLRHASKHAGSALVVEDPDRLTRQGYRRLLRILETFVLAGVEIHITQKNWIIKTEADLDRVELGVSAVVFGAVGNEHSAKLSDRMGKVWRSKKANSDPGMSITARLPGWLNGKAGEPIKVDKVKAAVVKRIFQLAADGYGVRLIVREFNLEGVPTFTTIQHARNKGVIKKVWHTSYIQKILNNRAVLGEYQPMKGSRKHGKTRTTDGGVRHDFFPAIITHDLWNRAHESKRRRATAKVSGRTGKVKSLFSGLVFDATMDGLPMYYQDKGKRSRPRLATNAKDRTGATGHTIAYEAFERAFLHYLDELDWTEVLDVVESEDLQATEKELSRLISEIAHETAQIEKLATLLVDTPSSTLKARLIAAEANLERLIEQRSAAEKRLTEIRQQHQDLLDDSIAYEKLATTTDVLTRARLRQEVRKKVSRIEFRFRQAHTACTIHFINGVIRRCLWVNERLYLITGDGRSGDSKFWSKRR